MPEEGAAPIPPKRAADEFLSQPEKLDDPSVGALSLMGLIHTDWSAADIEILLARRIRDAVAGLQGVGRAFGDRGMSPRMLEILRSIARANHAFVEGHPLPEGSGLDTNDVATILRPRAVKLAEGVASYRAALDQQETALADTVRGTFHQCRESIRSGFQWEPRQRSLILEPSREFLSEVLIDPDASTVGELWLLDGMLGFWQNDDRMAIERSFDRGIHCRVKSDPFVSSLLYRFKALAASQSGRNTQALEAAQVSIKTYENWETYFELAHYALAVENTGEALSAIRSGCRLFPLGIALIVASEALAPLWPAVDSNFLRYLDDFRSHCLAELKGWETLWQRAQNVKSAGIDFAFQGNGLADSASLKRQLENENGLRLISVPAHVAEKHARLKEALEACVAQALNTRFEDLRGAKADLKAVESRHDSDLLETEKKVQEAKAAVRKELRGKVVDTQTSLNGCMSQVGVSVALFVAVSVVGVMMGQGPLSGLTPFLMGVACLPGIIAIGRYFSVVSKNSNVARTEKQKLAKWQAEYERKAKEIEERSQDRITALRRRAETAEERYRQAQEAERALRGDVYRPKGATISESGLEAA